MRRFWFLTNRRKLRRHMAWWLLGGLKTTQSSRNQPVQICSIKFYCGKGLLCRTCPCSATRVRQNGVSVSWRPSMEFPGNLYRGEGIVHAAPEKVWACVKPLAGTLRDKWDENVSSFEIIESLTDMLCVSRTASPPAAMKLISPRDFVDLVLVKKYEDGSLSSSDLGSRERVCTCASVGLYVSVCECQGQWGGGLRGRSRGTRADSPDFTWGRLRELGLRS
ncbi:stAR-related lipid transfer protein 5 isoform X2 [Ursus arctos]|uniref:stAR-related lipid transfer protein 5 isoform X2 n=1 Tax=Ursus arctos TaxID=9644 RepID=UPI002548675B|nr:stAR-related lipid transfer protein 5 isoform X2 [Ursus arctos]